VSLFLLIVLSIMAAGLGSMVTIAILRRRDTDFSDAYAEGFADGHAAGVRTFTGDLWDFIMGRAA
jgi:hypothetical protein